MFRFVLAVGFSLAAAIAGAAPAPAAVDDARLQIIVGGDGDPDHAGCTWCGECVLVTFI